MSLLSLSYPVFALAINAPAQRFELPFRATGKTTLWELCERELFLSHLWRPSLYLQELKEKAGPPSTSNSLMESWSHLYGKEKTNNHKTNAKPNKTTLILLVLSVKGLTSMAELWWFQNSRPVVGATVFSVVPWWAFCSERTLSCKVFLCI